MSSDSKFLSRVLRHEPELIDIRLDPNGWAQVDDLLRSLKKAGRKITESQLVELVEANDKRRFTLSDDGHRIRAAQGHSVEVNLGLPSVVPPETLYHGTASQSLDAIFQTGLNPGRRRQVHLLSDPETVKKVASDTHIPQRLYEQVRTMDATDSAPGLSVLRFPRLPPTSAEDL